VARRWQIVIAPMHVVGITADSMEQHNEVLTFTKDGVRCGQFHSYMGWIEVVEEPAKERATASVTALSVVPKVDPASPPPADQGWDGNGAPVDEPSPAALLSFPFKSERP
jgi:hypothetical protein